MIEITNWNVPMSSSSTGSFSPYKCLVEGEVVGSRSTGCVCNLPKFVQMFVN